MFQEVRGELHRYQETEAQTQHKIKSMIQAGFLRANIPIVDPDAYPREIRALYLNLSKRLVGECNWRYADWVMPPGSLTIGINEALENYYCLYILADSSVKFQALNPVNLRYNVVYNLEGFFVGTGSKDNIPIEKSPGQTLEDFIFDDINKRVCLDYAISME